MCLGALWQANPRPGMVFLVDDASTDDSVDLVAQWARNAGIDYAVMPVTTLTFRTASSPWLTIITAHSNTGFVGTSNRGLRHARDLTNAPYVLLLNNDAAIAPSFFSDLADAVERYPDVGLLSGSIYEWDRETVWYAGARFNALRSVARHQTTLPPDDSPRETEYVCACTMLISRKVLEEVGLLADCFSPCYGEDVDYSLRARAAGFPVMYAPRAICYHRVGSSLGRLEKAPRTVFSVNRNRVLTVRRNFRGWQRVTGVAYLVVTKPCRALWELARGRPSMAWAVLSGMLTGVLAESALGSGERQTRANARI